MSLPRRLSSSAPPYNPALEGTHLALRTPGADFQAFDAQQLFVQGWPWIRRAAERAQGRLGVAVIAFDPGGRVVAEQWVAASVEKTRSSVVGRHPSCSVPVPSSFNEIPLRHLLLLVRAKNNEEVEVRAIDLHTSLGFGDESGRALQSAMLGGTAFLSLGALHLAIVETSSLDIADAPEVAYRAVPGRVFADEEPGPYLAGPRLVRAHDVDGLTIVRSRLGPLAAAGPLLEDEEAIRGRLTLGSRGLAVTRDVGPAALKRGILVGRYSRCDVSTQQDSETLSRVHALLLEDHGQVVLVDTASSNGIWVDNREVRVLRLDPEGEAWLGRPGEGLGLIWAGALDRKSDP